MTKVKVNKDVCIGCGACASIVSEVFDIGDEGFAYVKTDKFDDSIKEEILDAAENCPVSAIEVDEQ